MSKLILLCTLSLMLLVGLSGCKDPSVPVTFTVTASGSNLSVSPSSPISVVSGATQAISVTASTGYTTSQTVTGTCPAGTWSGSTYTTGSITANCTVIFSTTINSYTVTATGTNATVTDDGPQTVTYGLTLTYFVTAMDGYNLIPTVGGTCTQGSWRGAIYTTGPIATHCTVNFTAYGRFLYAQGQNAGTGAIYVYSIGGTGLLTPVGTTAFTHYPATALATDPFGKFLYVVTDGSGILIYSINPVTGVLTSGGSLTGAVNAAGFGTNFWGLFAYVPNWNLTDTISIFSIDYTSGNLTSSGSVSTAGNAGSITFDPSGQFAYAPNFENGTVSMYSVNNFTGALTSNGTVAAGANPYQVAIDPLTKFAYVADGGSNLGNGTGGCLSEYTINSSTGVLTANSPSFISTQNDPRSVVIHPSGKYVYAANNSSSTVSMYTVNSTTGLLSANSPATVPTGTVPSVILLDPTGSYAYVDNYDDSTISMYVIDQSTGILSPNTTATIPTGNNPGPMVIANPPVW